MDAVARNARLNGVSVQCVTDNAFDFLKKEAALVRDGGKHKWDLIILDPPSFTRNKKSVHDAMRGYKEIHLRAMKLLAPGGILSTFCCSPAVKLSRCNTCFAIFLTTKAESGKERQHA